MTPEELNYSVTTTTTNTHKTMTTKTPVTIQLPTEVSYYGSTATEADVARILDNLEPMILAQFGDRAEITFERMPNPPRSGIVCDDAELHEEIHHWIAYNWTAAL